MKILLVFALLLSVQVRAQVQLPTNEVGQVQYQEIVRLSNAKLPARQLMEQVKAWAAKHYSSNLTTEQQYDQEHNILFIKSSFSVDNQLVRYVLTIEPKFGRYRATITELIAEGNGLTVPILAASSTAQEMERATNSKTTNRKLLEQAAAQQADLYRQINKDCRATLADLKQTILANT